MDIQTITEFEEIFKECYASSYSESEVYHNAQDLGCTHQEAAELAVISFMVNQ